MRSIFALVCAFLSASAIVAAQGARIVNLDAASHTVVVEIDGVEIAHPTLGPYTADRIVPMASGEHRLRVLVDGVALHDSVANVGASETVVAYLMPTGVGLRLLADVVPTSLPSGALPRVRFVGSGPSTDSLYATAVIGDDWSIHAQLRSDTLRAHAPTWTTPAVEIGRMFRGAYRSMRLELDSGRTYTLIATGSDGAFAIRMIRESDTGAHELRPLDAPDLAGTLRVVHLAPRHGEAGIIVHDDLIRDRAVERLPLPEAHATRFLMGRSGYTRVVAVRYENGSRVNQIGRDLVLLPDHRTTVFLLGGEPHAYSLHALAWDNARIHRIDDSVQVRVISFLSGATVDARFVADGGYTREQRVGEAEQPAYLVVPSGTSGLQITIDGEVMPSNPLTLELRAGEIASVIVTGSENDPRFNLLSEVEGSAASEGRLEELTVFSAVRDPRGYPTFGTQALDGVLGALISLERSGSVRLVACDLLGRRIAEGAIVDAGPGDVTLEIDLRGVDHGYYFIALESSDGEVLGVSTVGW
jgi:hypothetical protein